MRRERDRSIERLRERERRRRERDRSIERLRERETVRKAEREEEGER